MLPDRLHEATQQDLVTLLCLSQEHGALVAQLIDPATFDGDYREIAIRAVAYWDEYKRAPGEAHVGNLVADIVEDKNNRRRSGIMRVLEGMLRIIDKVNAEYVLNQLRLFARLQGLKDALLSAAEMLNAPAATTIEDVEGVLADVLKANSTAFDKGTKLNDDIGPFLDYLRLSHEEFITGLMPLDQRGIVPSRGAIMLFIAGKGRGKTWFLTNIGKNALLLHKRVLHVSLEINEPEMRQRYYQALFAVPRHKTGEVEIAQFELGDNGVRGIRSSSIEPDFGFNSLDIGDELTTRMDLMGKRADNLIIKRFPNRTLTVPMLSGFLDMLDRVEHFSPDIVCLDYAKLMKVNARSSQEFRLSVGENLERLRALAVERNFALVTADQLNRKGYGSEQARSVHIGEDWSQVHTADIVLTHSATDAEMRHGLCRIYVDHARTEADKFGILVSQNFTIGQFGLQSAFLPANYYDEIMPGHPVEEDEEDDDNEGRAHSGAA
jgi:hypothetical protein